MSPDERKFAEIIRNAEAFARQSPRAYRMAVFALASAGYLYIVTAVIGFH